MSVCFILEAIDHIKIWEHVVGDVLKVNGLCCDGCCHRVHHGAVVYEFTGPHDTCYVSGNNHAVEPLHDVHELYQLRFDYCTCCV